MISSCLVDIRKLLWYARRCSVTVGLVLQRLSKASRRLATPIQALGGNFKYGCSNAWNTIINPFSWKGGGRGVQIIGWFE